MIATVLVLGLFIAWLTNLDWRVGLLMAAIVGSTDAAAVFSLLRNGGVKLNDRVQATLEIESGANDPMAILLVTVMIALNIDPESQTIGSIIAMLLGQIGIGLVIGLLSGYVLSKLLPKVHLAEGMYAILILSAGLAVFGFTNLLGGSGFLAIYLAGVIIGNNKIRATEHVLRVMDSFAWLSQAVLFVMLGLLVLPSSLWQVWHYSLFIFLFLLFVARPFAVFSSLLPFGFKKNEVGFISWVGLRGAVPITLAILPVTNGVEYASFAFNITFGVVILSLLVQGASIPFMSRVFKVWVPTDGEPKAEHEIWVGDQANITLYEFEVKTGAFAIGRHPQNISDKVNADEIAVFALVRHGRLASIKDDTILKVDDVVWYALKGGNYASSIAKVFNNTATQYKQSSEFYGGWLLSPHVRIADLPFYKSTIRPYENKLEQNKFVAALDSLTLFKQSSEQLDGVDDELLHKLSQAKHKTIAEFIMEHLTTEPVKGDRVRLNDVWSLVVRDVDAQGRLRSVGVKKSSPKE